MIGRGRRTSMGLDLLALVSRLERRLGVRITRAVAGSPLYDPAFDPPAGVKKKGWTRPDKQADWGRLSFWLALLADCLFLGAGIHVHDDRTNRIPIVTWEPVGASLAIAAAMVWCAAVLLARTALRRSVSWFPWALGAVFCAIQGAFWFLFYLGALYET
jgi:hypothetical protein